MARCGRKASIPGLMVKAIERDEFTNMFRETILAGEMDHILIDLAGAREATVLKAIARSELVIIPAQASEPDLREALVVVSDIRDVAEEKGTPIEYRVLLTKMYPLRTRVTEFVYQELARLGLPIFGTVLVERAAYREMFLTGTPPSASDAGGAGAEIGALVRWQRTPRSACCSLSVTTAVCVPARLSGSRSAPTVRACGEPNISASEKLVWGF